ncbi:hypothetical protein GJ496_007147 [Pomphorhynchus laevis]|nr:hypothetical protein GJ496_007147 [Pomphorhynchus laevis]
MCTSENAYFGSEHQSSYGNVPVINDSAGITNGKGKVPSPTSFPSDLQHPNRRFICPTEINISRVSSPFPPINNEFTIHVDNEKTYKSRKNRKLNIK